MTTSPAEQTQDTTQVVELRVAGRTPTPELAAAIAHAIYAGRKVRLRAIGAGAVNQAVKGLVLAQQYTSGQGLILANRPGFINVDLEGEERTAVVFHVFVT